ncbi:hypothetical protein WA026_012547 [Henosepilachna vigintioctopunctata]|uniref:Protein zer-1 homolog-like C-terminal domain-containing protein n=1 Tax=Henosepilachna vigintioctopunctata TaxID=420089 RepID=A0AAW1U135_9CUCU
MFQNPQCLEELCIDAVVKNIELYIKPIFSRKKSWCTSLGSEDKSEWKYVFRDPDIFLIRQISEKLMSKLLEKKLLRDATLNIFSEENTRLQCVRITDCEVSESGLKILKNHKIVDLECVNLKYISIANIIDCLSEWTRLNMINANFSKCSFIDSSRHTYMVKIVSLKNLRSLNLADTELNQHCFSMICTDLLHLEKLDISGTQVRDLVPLSPLCCQLKSIGLSDLPNVSSFVNVLLKMEKLQYLDVSIVKEKLDISKMDIDNSPVAHLLRHNAGLPNLISLEISGWKECVPSSVLYDFIMAHSKLEYLGIVLCDLMLELNFSDVSFSKYPSHLVIGGLGNKEQIMVTLQKYKDRSGYVQKALYHLFQITNGEFAETSPKMFELVLPVMAAHPTKFGVQMAATACLYNLTKSDLSKRIHPNLLSRGINLTLDAMSHFSKDYQLQKNSLLTLCNDRILQEVNFDRFRCARLVLDALCSFCDNNISRMAVAICSNLAAKISTVETSSLGARPKYMRQLLKMVENRVENIVSDMTLTFTLSALWNLTDESPATCTVFLEQQGAVLFLNVLQTFKNDSTIETKVLGLLNNIAEVATLRQGLMLNDLISELYSLLKSENIDVSYFAAGIVAHLASDGEEQWTARSHSRNEMLSELETAIMLWQVPQSEIASYRSFKPFFPLLSVDLDYRAQLWALWAIHHVCTKSPKRYCAMLREENGVELLIKLIKFSQSHIEIKNISNQIMDTLKQHL